MAVQSEGPGQFQEFLDIISRRRWQIILPALFCLSVGIFCAVVVPKKFKVSTQVELRGLFLEGGQRQETREQTQGVAENAPQQLQSPKRVKEVLEDLKWPDYLTLDATGKAEFNERVRGNLNVKVPRRSEKAGSFFVTIEFTDVNKERAQVFLKALRKAWIDQVVERERIRHDVEYQKLINRVSELDKSYQNAIDKRTVLRNENDISPTQPTPGQNAMRLEDPTFLRLESTKTRQDEVASELVTARQTLVVMIKQLSETEPEIPKTSVTQGLSFEKEIAQVNQEQLALEAQLDGIRPAHPRYQQVTRELEGLDERKALLELKQTEEEVNLDFGPNPAYTDLEAQVNASELSVARLEAESESLRKMRIANLGDARRAQEAYAKDEVITNEIQILKGRMLETAFKLADKQQRREVIYGPSGNPFQVIQEVEPPSDPTEPNPWLIIAFSLVLGLGVGLGSSVAVEFTSGSFRGPADLHRVLMVPVLGVIGPIVTRAQRGRVRVRRLAVLCFTLALVGSVLFVTWAWENDPDLLSDGLNDGIQELRELFL